MYSSEALERFYFQYQTEALSHGCFIWNFIGTFFKNIFNGYKDYVNVVPDKITLCEVEQLLGNPMKAKTLKILLRGGVYEDKLSGISEDDGGA